MKPDLKINPRDYGNGISLIYFLTIADKLPIKIGKTTNLSNRYQQYTLHLPWPPKVLAIWPVNCVTKLGQLEKSIHFTFKEHRLQGEWFKPVKVIKDLIKFINDDRLAKAESLIDFREFDAEKLLFKKVKPCRHPCCNPQPNGALYRYF